MSALPERNPTQKNALLPPSTFEECSIKEDYIILERSDGTKRFLPFSRIMYCDVRNSRVSIHTVAGRIYTLTPKEPEMAANLAKKIAEKLNKVPPQPYTIRHLPFPRH